MFPLKAGPCEAAIGIFGITIITNRKRQMVIFFVNSEYERGCPVLHWKKEHDKLEEGKQSPQFFTCKINSCFKMVYPGFVLLFCTPKNWNLKDIIRRKWEFSFYRGVYIRNQLRLIDSRHWCSILSWLPGCWTRLLLFLYQNAFILLRK